VTATQREQVVTQMQETFAAQQRVRQIKRQAGRFALSFDARPRTG
jgi:hypothetical protein